jgi:hypothetical protein
MSACSRPTPAVSTPAIDRIHSSIASSRAIRSVPSDADSRTGNPSAATGRTTTASSHPVVSATTEPRPVPTARNVNDPRDIRSRGNQR